MSENCEILPSKYEIISDPPGDVGIIIPEGCFLVCPKCAESAELEAGDDLRCPVCDVPYIISSPITYDEEGKPYRLNVSALPDRKMAIRLREATS